MTRRSRPGSKRRLLSRRDGAAPGLPSGFVGCFYAVPVAGDWSAAARVRDTYGRMRAALRHGRAARPGARPARSPAAPAHRRSPPSAATSRRSGTAIRWTWPRVSARPPETRARAFGWAARSWRSSPMGPATGSSSPRAPPSSRRPASWPASLVERPAAPARRRPRVDAAARAGGTLPRAARLRRRGADRVDHIHNVWMRPDATGTTSSGDAEADRTRALTPQVEQRGADDSALAEFAPSSSGAFRRCRAASGGGRGRALRLHADENPVVDRVPGHERLNGEPAARDTPSSSPPRSAWNRRAPLNGEVQGFDSSGLAFGRFG